MHGDSVWCVALTNDDSINRNIPNSSSTQQLYCLYQEHVIVYWTSYVLVQLQVYDSLLVNGKNNAGKPYWCEHDTQMWFFIWHM